MKTFFISAGHSNVSGKDRGAAANGYIEGIEAVHLRNIVAENLRCHGLSVVEDEDNMVTGESVRYFDAELAKTTGVKIVADIHFNSGKPSATGTEVIVRNNATKNEVKLATMLSANIAAVLKIKNRGVKTEAQTARKTLHLFEKIKADEAIAVLIEICFISNPNDMKAYIPNTYHVGQSISDTLIEFNEAL